MRHGVAADCNLYFLLGGAGMEPCLRAAGYVESSCVVNCTLHAAETVVEVVGAVVVVVAAARTSAAAALMVSEGFSSLLRGAAMVAAAVVDSTASAEGFSLRCNVPELLVLETSVGQCGVHSGRPAFRNPHSEGTGLSSDCY